MSEIIRLRPHHVTGLFLKDVFKTEEEIRQELKLQRYTPRMINNLLGINRRVLQDGAPVVLVHSLDDICRECSEWKKKSMKELCLGKDAGSDLEGIHEFKIRYGRAYPALNLVIRFKKYYQEMAELCQVNHALTLSSFETKLSRYTSLYESLRQKRGAK